MSVDNSFETPEQRLPEGMTLWEMHSWLRPSYDELKVPEKQVTFFQAADMVHILEERHVVTPVEARMMRARLLSLKDRERNKVLKAAEATAAGHKRKVKELLMVVSAVSSADSAVENDDGDIASEARRLVYKNRWSSAKSKKKSVRILTTNWTLERATARYKRHLRKKQAMTRANTCAQAVSLPPISSTAPRKRQLNTANNTDCDADDEDDRVVSNKRQRVSEAVVPNTDKSSKRAASEAGDIIITSMSNGGDAVTSTTPSIVRTAAKTNTLQNFLSLNKAK